MLNAQAMLIATTTVTRTRTHADLSPLQQIIYVLPFLVIIIGMVVAVITLIRSEYKGDNSLFTSFKEPDTISGKMLYNSLQETREYYKNNRKQMTIIFICAIVSCFVGLTVLLASVFYFADEAKTMSAISGGVISFISGAFFWIYKQCSNQVQTYFNALNHIQNIFIAIELIKECSDENKDEKIGKIIDNLIQNSPPKSQDSDD